MYVFFLGASIYFVDERSLYIVKNSIFREGFDSLCCYVIFVVFVLCEDLLFLD